MQKVIVAFVIVMTMLTGAALAENGAGQAPCGRGKVGCFSTPHSQPQILKQQDQQFSADSSCRVAGTTWEAQDGGIFEIEADLTGTFRFPSCKKPFPFVVTLVGNRLTFHAATGDPKECQGFYEDVTIDSSCKKATGKWTNDDGSSGPDTWYRQGITLSRLDLTRYKASGTPDNGSGSFKWTVVPLPGVKPPKVHPDIKNDVYYTKYDNPNGVILIDPKSPAKKGEPSPGGLFKIFGKYSWQVDKAKYQDADYMLGATFGMSCYNTALESDWGTPPGSCITGIVEKMKYEGVYTPQDMKDKYNYETTSTYCKSFIENTRIEGFGRLDRTNPTKYLAYTRAAGRMWLTDSGPVGNHNNALVPGKSVARDPAIIPDNTTRINVNWIGREPGQPGIGLSADDVGTAIKGYRLDWYGGEGKWGCDLPPPPGKQKSVGFKNPITIGACTPEQKVGGNVTCPSDIPMSSSQGWQTEQGFSSSPLNNADGRFALADSDVSSVFVKNNEIVISTEAVEQMRLTHNGIAKDLPVWSKDGSRIAFIEKTNRNTALSRLRVIGRDGNSLFSFLVHPVTSNPHEAVLGMRFVERVEWITDSKIAVSGSINPSTCENIVFDLSTGSISNNFFDDGCNAAYSPDGLHVAYITGAPHFTPESGRERELVVDGIRVFPQSGTQVKFITDPKWSKDSQALAIIATEDKGKTSSVVMWRPNGEPSVIPFSMEEETFHNGTVDLFWNGQSLVLTSGQQTWSFSR